VTAIAVIGAVGIGRLIGGWLGLIVAVPVFFLLIIVGAVVMLIIEATLRARSERLNDETESDQIDGDS